MEDMGERFVSNVKKDLLIAPESSEVMGQRNPGVTITRPPGLVARGRCALSREERGRLLEFPGLSPQPPFHIAGCPNKIVLQFHFGQAAVARVAQAVRPDQFALRAFNGITVFHALLESWRPLFLSP